MSIEEKKGNKILSRFILSVIAIVVYGWINFLMNPIGTIESAKLAGKQLESRESHCTGWWREGGP